MKYIFGICSFLLFVGCTEQHSEPDKNTPSIIAETDVETSKQSEGMVENFMDDYSAKAIFSPDHGWGYQILNHDELYINQPHIPAIPGNNGFDSEDKALTTAQFVIYKLNNGIVPPTVSPEELDSLGVMN